MCTRFACVFPGAATRDRLHVIRYFTSTKSLRHPSTGNFFPGSQSMEQKHLDFQLSYGQDFKAYLFNEGLTHKIV